MIVGNDNKNPRETPILTIDWATKFLAARTIAASSWVVPEGLELLAEGESAGVTSAQIGGGLAGKEYEVINAVTLSTGEKFEGAILLLINKL